MYTSPVSQTPETLKIGPIDVTDLRCTGEWRPNLVTKQPKEQSRPNHINTGWDRNPDRSYMWA